MDVVRAARGSVKKEGYVVYQPYGMNKDCKRKAFPLDLWVTLTLIGLLFCTVKVPFVLASPSKEIENGYQVKTLPTLLKGRWEAGWMGGEVRPEDVDPAKMKWVNIEVPGRWNRIFGSRFPALVLYRTRLFIPAKYRHIPLGFSFYRIRDVDRLLVNGYRVGQTGDFPPNFQKANLIPRIYSIPATVLRFDAWNTLEVWVYSQARTGGLVSETPRIGKYVDLRISYQRYGMWILLFVFLFGFVGFHHGLLFFYRATAREHVIYTILSILMALYMWTFHPLAQYSGISLNALFRINIGTLTLIAAAIVVFMFTYFQTRIPRYIRYLISTYPFMAVYILVWAKVKHIYVLLEFIEVVSMVAMIPIFKLLIDQLRGNRSFARILSVGFIIFFSSAMYDVGNDFGWLPNAPVNVAGLILPLGFAFLHLTFGYALAVRFRRYERRATYDTLTGLLQRERMTELVDHEIHDAIRDSRYIVGIMLDLDDFKRVNDQFSHTTGDELLKAFGRSIQKVIRKSDLAGRVGGDEFVIVLNVERRSEAVQIIERIQEAIAEIRITRDDQVITPTASIGVAWCIPDKGFHWSELIHEADLALLRSKAKGKNKVTWHHLEKKPPHVGDRKAGHPLETDVLDPKDGPAS